MKVLLALGDFKRGESISEELLRNRYSVDFVISSFDILSYLLSNSYDILVIKKQLPDSDGLDVIKEIRSNKCTVPVLLIVDNVHDKIAGLEAGADGLLRPDFTVAELVTHIKALLRRAGSYKSETLTYKDLTLNCDSYELSVGTKKTDLRSKEYQLMVLFMRNPQRTFSTEDLMIKVWGWDSASEINVVWTNITRLRLKMRNLGSKVTIKSARSIGYRLE